jgi:hypothetical protein
MAISLFYIGAVAQSGAGGVVAGDGPVANTAASSTTEETGVTLNVMANDTHPTGDTLTLVSASVSGAQGTANANTGSGTVTYIPAAGFIGEATVSYVIRDSLGRLATGAHTVTVSAIGPTAVDDTGTTPESVALTINVIGNDTHDLGDDLTLVSVSVPIAQGTVVDNSDGTITFTPTAGFTGNATITYTVEDENGDADGGIVTVLVTGQGPTAVNDTASTPENTAVTVDVLANDTHPLSDTLVIDSATLTAGQGTVSVVSNEILYTPATNFNGSATITYVAEDESGDQDTGTLVVTVVPDAAPVANPDTATTTEETVVDIDVLANDTHGDSDALTVVGATVGSIAGTVSIVSNMVRYTPAVGFDGTATINYTVEDTNGDQDTGTVTVTVNPDAAPVAVDDTATVAEDGTILIDVLANDTHADSDALTVEAASLLTGQGTVTVESNQVRYVPAADFNGTATISYTVEDTNGDQDTGTVTVTVTAVDDDPVAVGDTGTMDEGTTASFDVLANDTHPDGDTLTLVSVTLNTPADGTAVVNAGQIDFTPASGVTGAVGMTYVVEDANGDQDTGTLTVTVNAVVPTAVDDTANTAADTLVTVDVLANDTHPQSDTLTLVSVTLDTPAQGTAVVNAGQIDFTPASGVSGPVVMTYVVEDSTGDQDTGTLTATVASAGGPYADPFDDPDPTKIVYERWIDGSTSGNSTTNCDIWSNRDGPAGAGDGVQWKTNGSGREECRTATYSPLDDVLMVMRFRYRTDSQPTSKLYFYGTQNFMDSLDMYIDISNDATPSGSRGLGLGSNVSDVWVEEHPTNGFTYVKATVDMTGLDAVGQLFWYLSDQDHNGDGLIDHTSETNLKVADLTFEDIS